MSVGPRSAPPALPNLVHCGYLGGGGFADVFLYDQSRPSRKVAIKVLRSAALDDDARVSFDAEADLMARVSTHPYIVTIFGADVAPDGRPYIVMEYYPRPHLGLRLRSETIPVAEVLQAGVHLAGAIETAHRAGILHRDIKPANVLVSQHGRLGLTDFGIAGSAGLAETNAATGVSIPYAAPEVLRGDTDGDEKSEVYSLAATLYALLAGRAPYEQPHGDNANVAVTQRTLAGDLPPIGRADLPDAVELLLRHALSRAPEHRPASAAELGRAIQGAERRLGHAPTELIIDDASAHQDAPLGGGGVGVVDDDGTRPAPIRVVREESGPETVARASVTAASALDEPLARGRSTPAAASDTVARPRAPEKPADRVPVPGGAPTPASRSSMRWAIAAGASVVLVVVGIVLIAARGGGGGDGGPTTTEVVDQDALVVPEMPPVPTAVTVVMDGTDAVVSWVPGADAEAGDTYLVVRTDRPDAATTEATGAPVRVPVEEGASPCFEVSAQRGSRPSIDASTEVCA
jgi:hypothetical protein